MATAMKEVFEVVRQMALRDGGALSDGDLLGAYVQRGEESALAALVHRHGGMVWNVCRRILGVGQDAEDAFQAAFLVLVKKAATVRDPEKIANWLYGVARQTSVRMRTLRARRGNRERQMNVAPDRAMGMPSWWEDLQPLLDEELSRLPEKYRTLIVLCDLEEKTRSAVASQLGCPEGTVAGRLARAREMLAKRLVRRGIGATSSALATAFAALPAQAAPAALLANTIRMATIGTLPASVIALAQGVIQMMFLKQLRFAVFLFLAAAVFAIGGYFAYAAGIKQPDDPIGVAPFITVAQDDKNPAVKKELDPKIRMTVSAPQFRKPEPELLPDFTFWEVKVQYKNEGKDEMVLFPWLKVKVFDAANKPVAHDVFIGRGLFSDDYADEIDKDFLVIPPGKTKEVVVNLRDNQAGIQTQGWKFQQPGTYKIELTYKFNRKAFLAEYFREDLVPPNSVEAAGHPKRLWHRAMEMDKTVPVELKIGK